MTCQLKQPQAPAGMSLLPVVASADTSLNVAASLTADMSLHVAAGFAKTSSHSCIGMSLLAAVICIHLWISKCSHGRNIDGMSKECKQRISIRKQQY
jgi:hypothetical protein